jgi:hypothetical protein
MQVNRRKVLEMIKFTIHHINLSYTSTAQFGPWPPLLGFVTIAFSQGWIVSPAPNPNLEDQVSVFMTPGDRVTQLYPQALGSHFSRLLCFLHHHHHHHHYMTLQPNSGPGLPCWGFVTITFLQGWIVSPAPNPQPGGPCLRIYDPRRQGDPAIPPGTGYPF